MRTGTNRSRRRVLPWVAALALGLSEGVAIQAEEIRPIPPLALRHRTVSPDQGIDPRLAQKLGSEDARIPIHGFVVLDGAPTPERRESLRSRGVQLLEPVRGGVWIGVLSPEAIVRGPGADGITGITAVFPLEPRDKIHPHLLDFEPAPKAGDESDDGIPVQVILHRDSDSGTEVPRVARWLDRLEDGSRQGSRRIRGHLQPEHLESLSRLEAVLWIEPRPEGAHPVLVDRVREAIQSEPNRPESSSDPTTADPKPRLDGAGVRVAIFDTGVDPDHLDFADRILRTSGSSTHGTHVAGILAGSGELSETVETSTEPREWRGVAPAAELLSYAIGMGEEEYREAVELGARLTTNSFVQSLHGEYDSDAARLDELVRGAAGNPLTILFAAGNNGAQPQYGSRRGYYSTFTTAKNTLSIGATHVDTGIRAGFSSLGPTYDGRIKPDLVAPGCTSNQLGIRAPFPRNRYGRMCGTSMSTPAVAGGVALLYQAFDQISLGGEEAVTPFPSTIKALLIETARDLVHTNPGSGEPHNPDTGEPTLYGPGPDYATGWGLVDIGAAVDAIDDHRFLETTVRPGRSHRVLLLSVPEDRETLSVTMAWDDPPASPLLAESAGKLVHDLDLTLTSPSGSRLLPWILDPPAHEPLDGNLSGIDPIHTEDLSEARRGIDRINNVEKVSLEAPESGLWRVEIRGRELTETQTVSLATNVPLSVLSVEVACLEPAETPDDHPRARVRVLNHRDDPRPVRARLALRGETNPEIVELRSLVRDLPPLARPEKELSIPIPEGLDNPTLIVELLDPESGALLAEGHCPLEIGSAR